jgi:hypothetical protein
MTNTPSNKPTHRVFAVAKRGENKRWQEIGAAWGHKDGKGFNLKIEYLPLNGAEMVIRVADAAEIATADEANGASIEGGF